VEAWNEKESIFFKLPFYLFLMKGSKIMSKMLSQVVCHWGVERFNTILNKI